MKFSRLTVFAIATSSSSAFGPGLLHNRLSLKNVAQSNRGMPIKMADEVKPDPFSRVEEPIFPENVLETVVEEVLMVKDTETDTMNTIQQQAVEAFRETPGPLALDYIDPKESEIGTPKATSPAAFDLATGASLVAVPTALIVGARSLLESSKAAREDKAREDEIARLVAEQDARNKAKASSKSPFGVSFLSNYD